MKLLVTTGLLMVALGLQTSAAQLSGTYTVGGDSPEFATLQEAADSLMLAGVTGSVNVLARPGVYTETGGSLRALDLPGDIPGTSALARVRFAPDRSSGATKTNVVLRRSSGARDDGFVVQIKSSHTTVAGFTIELADTTAGVAEIPSLVYLEAVNDSGVDNLLVDGLGGRRAWRCISLKDVREDVFVTNNRISACVEPIHQLNFGPVIPADRLTVTGNHATGMSILPEKRDPEFGVYLRLDGGGEGVVVSDNVLDFQGASGLHGIAILGATKRGLRVERNQVLGLDVNYFPFGVGNLLHINGASEGLVANNFLSGNSSGGGGVVLELDQFSSDTLTFAHNTVRVSGGTCRALQVLRDDRFPSFVRVLDNILISEGNCGNSSYQHMSYTSTTPSNSEIDYNIHSFLSNIPLAFDNIGGYYVDLPAWQAAGFGEHSLIQRVEFVDDQTDLHLGECAFEDETLRGLALPLIPTDFDSEGRDPLFPFIGADEPGGAPPPVFESPIVSPAGTGPRGMASADLDGDGDIDVVVTLPGSFGGGQGDNDVSVLLNDGAGAFSAPQHLPMANDPSPVQIGRVNNDDELDLVVSGTDGIWVRYGSGGGAFSPPEQLNAGFSTGDLELADYDNDGDLDIFGLYSPSTDSGLVWVLNNTNDGSFLWSEGWGVGQSLSDFELADLDQDGFPDLVVVDAITSGQLFTLKNLGVDGDGFPVGFDVPVAYAYSVSSGPSESTFAVGDFDGDLDPDVVLRALGSDRLVLIRNGGDGSLGEPEAFEPHSSGVPQTVAALDYEQDGDLDLVSASSLERLDLLLNDGSGFFERMILCSDGRLSGFPLAMVVDPLNGDASRDVGVLTFAPDHTASVEVLGNLEWVPSGVTVQDPEGLPSEEPRLYPNYPNPFSRITTVRYSLAETAPVRIDVFDLLGRRVATILDRVDSAGEHTVQFDAGGMASGVYLYRVSAGSFVETRTMVVLK